MCSAGQTICLNSLSVHVSVTKYFYLTDRWCLTFNASKVEHLFPLKHAFTTAFSIRKQYLHSLPNSPSPTCRFYHRLAFLFISISTQILRCVAFLSSVFPESIASFLPQDHALYQSPHHSNLKYYSILFGDLFVSHLYFPPLLGVIHLKWYQNVLLPFFTSYNKYLPITCGATDVKDLYCCLLSFSHLSVYLISVYSII